MSTSFDTVIIGGGPAGLSAAIYLARFRRSVLILDKGSGRWDNAELNENYLGFPQGIHARQLRELGVQQALRFGVECRDEMAEAVQRNEQSDESRFVIKTSAQQYSSRTLIIATGVHDYYFGLPEHEDYLGTSLFWCITCDGYKTIDKKLVVIGNNEEVACTTLQLLNYTKDLTLVTNATENKISTEWQERLNRFNIPVICKKVDGLNGSNRRVSAVRLKDGEQLPAEIVFNEQGARPNSKLAVDLGVKVDEMGYILTNEEQRTNIPFLYAAGDVTRLFSHQIVTAAHEGSMAAQAANYDMYSPEQRL